MMNKWLIVFFVILFWGTPKVVCAYDFESSGIYYIIDGDNVFVTSGDSKYQGVIAIPNQVKYNGKTYSVKIIGYGAFQDCKSLTSITIPNSVTSVGDFAFSSCSGLTSVTIPNSVTSIGGWAFYGCSGMTSVTIPNSVTSIGICSFTDCYSLTTVNLPNSLTYIGKQAFWECYGLKSINIPPKVTYIGDYPFSGCSGLSSIKVDSGNMYYDSRNDCNAIIETNSNKLIAGCNTTIIPSNVTSIGENSFQNCGGLSSLVIPSSVKSIGSQAFLGCRNLRNISIHDGVVSVGKQAFYETAWYNNQPDGLIYIGKIAYEYKGKMPDNTRVAIRDGIIGIAGEAFSYCSGLISVTIPKSVTSIGSSAFIDCSGLTSIKVESGNPNYDSRNNCNAIIESSSNTLIAGCKKTNIPNSVTSVGGSAFWGCSNLTSITIPNSVTTIGNSAFRYCSRLTSITIPNSVTSIAYAAFSGCSGLTTIVSEIEEPFKIDGWSTFSDDIYNNAELIVPKGTKAAYQATEGWNKFQNIVEASGGEEPTNNPSTKYSDQYLTFHSPFSRKYTFNGTKGNDSILYSINGDWRTLARGESVHVEGGEDVRWKGNLTPDLYEGIGNFVDDGEPFEVYGNIMSLLYGDDFIGKTSLGGKSDAFRELFCGCGDLYYAENLVLPATTLADRCYSSMFENCKSLTTAPVLPATSLAEFCYSNMFDGCRRLTTAPDLPATTLANGCYNSMFAGCSSINHVKCLATDLGTNSTTDWLYGVSSSGTFVKSSSMNDWTKGENGIPEGWTIQNDNESSSEKDEVAFTIDGIAYEGSKSEKTVIVKAVDTTQPCIEIPVSVSYDGMTYQVTGITDGVFDGSSMAALIWSVEAALPNNAFSNASIGSNFLLYVKSSSYAPSSVKNVVVNGTAQTIVLSDDGGQFYCPQAFTARRISYSHNYSMETGKGSTMGWESIALPFDVQRIIHSTQGEIVPFAAYNNGSNQKPFWLAYMSAGGFKRTADIRANEAYIIAMPNNSSYQDNYILAGDVTFSAENITVPQTPTFNGTFLPAFSFVAKSSSVYALNVNNRYVRYSGSEKPGSVFIRDLRDVRPFEAYISNSSTRGVIKINFDDGTTDMEAILLTADDGREMIIHTLGGQQITRTTQRDFDSVWQQLPKGVYIVNGKKMIK